MNIRNVTAAIAIAAASFGAPAADLGWTAELNAELEAHPWRQCLYKFEKSANSVGNCGSGGCSEDARGRTLEQVCGDAPKSYTDIFAKRDAEVAKAEAAERAERDAITIRIGSPESAVIAKFGTPRDVKRTVTAAGVSKQLVYRDRIIYVDNGKVTAWQD